MTAFALDHVVIATADLPAAIDAYRRLGFDVRPGGGHPGNGTENAIMRFGPDYLELLGVSDAAVAERRERGRELVAFVRRVGTSLISFSLSVDDWTDGLYTLPGTLPSIPLSRELPGGGLFRWEMVVPGTSNCHRPWPFFIRWITPTEERLALEPPGEHANGSVGLAGVTAAMWSLDTLADLYRRFGMPDQEAVHDAAGGLDARTIEFDGTRLELTAPSSVDGLLGQAMLGAGEGPQAVAIRCRSEEATAAWLGDRGIRTSRGDAGLLVDPEATLGVRLLFVEADAPGPGRTWTGAALRDWPAAEVDR